MNLDLITKIKKGKKMGNDTIKIRDITVKPGEKVQEWVEIGQMLD